MHAELDKNLTSHLRTMNAQCYIDLLLRLLVIKFIVFLQDISPREMKSCRMQVIKVQSLWSWPKVISSVISSRP